MAIVRIDIRENDGSSTIAEAVDANPEQIEAARELALDITRNMALPETAASE
ncbi:hypothetical protein KKR91_01100 [Arthrobacter jiangjiafuii]|uniref:Uncharacterized protein n=1 Tax=Arthrobacter jiangjiafuii TaxID=2817475 RepID=A0A975R197_9MICC|nr:hypothetical protein [Arthrobacter jiangjiafuii]MBP3044896.1 hypothetical protein [Arthrobacter jiangjiafuii]QWC10281.1 hypothetical protein KKR91_01100 [Arthrobacter jiangjiafuii]